MSNILYSVQNSGGEVYGIFAMPPSDMSAEVWAAELKSELSDILGINSVRDSALPISDGEGGYKQVPRVVIDIDPWTGNATERLQRVHDTIGRLASEHMKPDN